MKLILLRHGETEDNINNILAGQDCGKLTAKGIEQSKEVGKELKEKYKIDMIFCSPLTRCRETLEHVLDEDPIDVPIYMSKLIEERDYGEYTGVEIDSINKESLNEDNAVNKEMGVESLIHLVKRVTLFLEDLKLEDENSTVLVVSHEEPIKIMVAEITGKTADKVEVNNAEAIVFEDFK
ncbi:MAG: histidine phosphatase family protein [Candidatus Shapirobacteria bacterium]|jgi:broad specificity phosphatase PhoE